jgi:hypothetical protein
LTAVSKTNLLTLVVQRVAEKRFGGVAEKKREGERERERE